MIGWEIHDIDRMRWLFGSEAKQVFARSYSLRTEVEDDITTHSVMIIFENGISAHMWYSETLPSPGWKRNNCSMQIIGDEGLIDFDPYDSVRVARKGTNEWETVYEFGDFAEERKNVFYVEDCAFVECILEEKTPIVTGEEGRKAVEIALAAYRSSEINDVVKLPL